MKKQSPKVLLVAENKIKCEFVKGKGLSQPQVFCFSCSASELCFSPGRNDISLNKPPSFNTYWLMTYLTFEKDSKMPPQQLLRNVIFSRGWVFIPVISAPRRVRRDDCEAEVNGNLEHVRRKTQPK